MSYSSKTTGDASSGNYQLSNALKGSQILGNRSMSRSKSRFMSSILSHGTPQWIKPTTECQFCCKRNLVLRDPLEISTEKEYMKMYQEEVVEGGVVDANSERTPLAMVNRALYNKYSSSQNYYYTKDINDLLASNRCAAVIKAKDLECLQEQEEYLKRFYKQSEYEGKVKMLAEYYKFHKDISRLYMLPMTLVLNKYHDRKRRVEYVKITRILKSNEEEESGPSSPNAGDEYLKLKEEDETEFNQAAWCRYQKHVKHWDELQLEKPGHYLVDHALPSGKIGRTHAMSLVPEMKTPLGMNKGESKPIRSISCSYTIQDLNQKLGEIICSNSRFGLDIGEHNDNESFTGLGNFLNFLKKNDLDFNPNGKAIVHPSPRLVEKETVSSISGQQPAGPASVFGSSVLKSINQAKDTLASKKFHHKNHVMLPSAYLPKKSSEILRGLKVSEERKMALEAKNNLNSGKQVKNGLRNGNIQKVGEPNGTSKPKPTKNEQNLDSFIVGPDSAQQNVMGADKLAIKKPMTVNHTPTPSINGNSNMRVGDLNKQMKEEIPGRNVKIEEVFAEGHRKKKSESNLNVHLQTLNNQRATMTSVGKGVGGIFIRKISLDDNISLHNFTKEESTQKKNLKVIPEVENKQQIPKDQGTQFQKMSSQAKRQEIKHNGRPDQSKKNIPEHSFAPDQKTNSIPVNTLDSNEIEAESPRITFTSDSARPIKGMKMPQKDQGSPIVRSSENQKNSVKKPEPKKDNSAKAKTQKTPTTTNKKLNPKRQTAQKDSGIKAVPQSDSPEVAKVKRNFDQKKFSHPMINTMEFGGSSLIVKKEERILKGSFVSNHPKHSNGGVNTVGSYHHMTNTPSSTHNNSGVEGNQSSSQSIQNGSKPIGKSESSTNVALRSFDKSSKDEGSLNKELGGGSTKQTEGKTKKKPNRGETAAKKSTMTNEQPLTSEEGLGSKNKPKFSLNTRHSSLGLTSSHNLFKMAIANSEFAQAEKRGPEIGQSAKAKMSKSPHKTPESRGTPGKTNPPVSKMYNFLNERSNSTSTDTGIIHSSRMNSNNKPPRKPFHFDKTKTRSFVMTGDE